MTQRLEAFCDGVFAFALTLLIIDVHAPEAGPGDSAPDLWSALSHLGPAIFAFLLSFAVILVTWINHHNTLKLVHRNSAAFMYANGLLLLSVVCIPFTTSLLGAFVLTNAAAPAVTIYNAALAVQAIGWLAIAETALRSRLCIDEHAAHALRQRRISGYDALSLYAALAVVASWLPRAVAVTTAATWLFWLILSLRIRAPEPADASTT